MFLRCLLVALQLILQSYCVLSSTPSPATTTATITNYNCSHTCTLRIGNNSPPQPSSSTTTGTCTEEITTTGNTASSCVLSSQDGYQQCRSLSEILSQFNGLVGSGDCLYLELEQGDYAISSLSTISVNYSLAVVAIDSARVTVSCSGQTGQPNRVNSSCAADLTVPLMFGKERGDVSVLLDGVRFQDCPRPLQFDDLDHVTITNCWFR